MVQTKYKILSIAAVVATVLLLPLGLGTNVDAVHAIDPQKHFQELDTSPVPLGYVEDTIGDMKIRAVFHFNFAETPEVVDSFRIFNQVGGYRDGSDVTFQLFGGVGPDKMKLYTATDEYRQERFLGIGHKYDDFAADVYLYKRGEDVAYRHLAYTDCKVADYSVQTLHDGDETFSGKTKFVIADVFTFDCRGYQPHCPRCIDYITAFLEKSETTSTLDLEEGQTWEDIYRWDNP